MEKSKIEIVREYISNYIKNIQNYTIDEVKTKEYIIKKYLDGTTLRRFLFNIYIPKEINNKININKFYEDFSNCIENNNKNKVVPKIEGIQKLECISNAYLENELVYQIEMKIEYIREE